MSYRARRYYYRILLSLGALAATLLAILWEVGGPAPRPVEASPGGRYRMGFEVALEWGNVQDYDTCQLNAGWYHDVTFRTVVSAPCEMEYVQTIEVPGGAMPNTSTLAAAIAANPGSLWLIGNEPDRQYYQDDVLPQVYAQVYHDLYQFIKSHDATAQVAPGGIVQPTPLRLQYLDFILADYQRLYSQTMPVDVWNIHNMILNEVSCDYDPANCWGAAIPPGLTATVGVQREISDNDNIDIFKEQIVAFRQWMKDRGYQDKPLIITEFGVLMPEELGFTQTRVEQFMQRTFNYLSIAADPILGYPGDCYRLVQRWAWFSLNGPEADWVPDPPPGHWTPGFNGGLFYPITKTITPYGIRYRDYLPPIFTDIIAVALAISPDPLPTTPPVSLTLTFTVEAQGEGGTLSNILVRFFHGPPAPDRHNQIGADQIIPSLSATCARGRASASVVWQNLPSGNHTIYAVVNQDHDITEGDLTNNTSQQNISIPTRRIFLPLAAKNSPPP